jgi:hypothetical protein
MNIKSKYDSPEILKPIESLINKSQKAQQKLTAGTWQHSMLQKNLKALQIAYTLMRVDNIKTNEFTHEDFQEVLSILKILINKVEKTETKFLQGTSQHTLQKNRLKSLRKASEFITKCLKRTNS